MVAQIVRNFSTFMDHGGLLPHSGELATGSWCEQCDCSLKLLHPVSLQSSLCLFLASVLVPWNFSVGTLYVCFISPVGVLWLHHLNIYHFITLVSGEDYKWRTSSVCVLLLLCVTATLVQTFSISHLKIPWVCVHPLISETEFHANTEQLVDFTFLVYCVAEVGTWLSKFWDFLLVSSARVRHWRWYQHAVLKH